MARCVRDALGGATRSRGDHRRQRRAAPPGDARCARCRELDPDDVVELAPGEASKSFAVYERPARQLVARGLDRGSAIVALGGGVVGDLAGFVAATLFRGIPVRPAPDDDRRDDRRRDRRQDRRRSAGGQEPRRRVLAAAARRVRHATRSRRCPRASGAPGSASCGSTRCSTARTCGARSPRAPRGPPRPASSPPPPELRDVIDRSIAYKAAIVGRDERELTGAARAAQPRPHRRPRDRDRVAACCTARRWRSG